MKTLDQVKPRIGCTVVKLHGEGSTKRRIMDMGITKGTDIFVVKVAPLGDPIELKVMTFQSEKVKQNSLK